MKVPGQWVGCGESRVLRGTNRICRGFPYFSSSPPATAKPRPMRFISFTASYELRRKRGLVHKFRKLR
jgi:hypothetical protein